MLRLIRLIALSLVLPISMPAYTEENKPDARKILTNMDNEYNKHKDLDMTLVVTLYSGDKVEKVVKARNYEKDGNKRLLRILEPADVAGMAILTVDADTIYVYLPEFNRVRRVAAHAKKNSFLGSDFSEQEIAILRYDELFDPELIKEEEKEYLLKLIPKPGKEFSAAYLMMWVDKGNGLFNRVEYYSEDGVKLKTQFRSETKDYGDGYIQTRVKMVDHLKNHSTEITFDGIKRNKGLSDKIFSRRYLEWGESEN
ncbi:MAG: hypothetical protein Kow0090_06490 [Myxococcota bacterium]